MKREEGLVNKGKGWERGSGEVRRLLWREESAGGGPGGWHGTEAGVEDAKSDFC